MSRGICDSGACGGRDCAWCDGRLVSVTPREAMMSSPQRETLLRAFDHVVATALEKKIAEGLRPQPAPPVAPPPPDIEGYAAAWMAAARAVVAAVEASSRSGLAWDDGRDDIVDAVRAFKPFLERAQ